MKKYLAAFSFIAVAILTGCVKEIKSDQQPATINELSVISQANNAAGGQGQNYVPNELLVKFKAGTSQNARANVLSRVSGTVQEHVVTNAMAARGDREGFFVVHTPLQALDAISKARGLAEVEYAEPNWIYTHETTANDNYFYNGSLWGMESAVSPSGSSDPTNSFGCQANTAWSRGNTGSHDVYVGVVDEGAMYYHADLTGNFGNPSETPGNNNDDDGNGKIDDTYGWDFVSNDNTTFDGTADDHGTHVSGTIGAIGNNGQGVAGVCWAVKIISAKFLGQNGGTTANAVKAVDYITDLKIRDGLNIVATNNSWGGGGFSKALQDAIARASQADILFIAAAGNDGRDIDASPSYPASYSFSGGTYTFSDGTTGTVADNIIAVAAIASNGTKPSWSNWGKNSVDLAAPGSGIYSTLPSGRGKNVTSSYGSYSGTSMATPHVTGAAALYASYHTAATAQSIKSAILNAAQNKPTSSVKSSSGGRLDVSSF